jgi:hypothetical protein
MDDLSSQFLFYELGGTIKQVLLYILLPLIFKIATVLAISHFLVRGA